MITQCDLFPPVLNMQSANTILWLLYNLARFPDVQGKLYEEVASVVGKDGDVTPKNIAKLPYLKACVKESAR